MSFTPRLIWLLALLMATAISGIWVGGWVARAWMLPTLLLLLMLFLEYWITSRYLISLKRQLPREVELGRTLAMHYHFQVQPARALKLEYAEVLPEALGSDDWQETNQFDAFGVISTQHTHVCIALQHMAFNHVHARVLGVFGLAWWPRQISEPAQVRVLPQSLTDAERRRFTMPFGLNEIRKSGQGSELLSLRDYQTGDPQRAIDWKASARAAADALEMPLKVRVMSQELNLEVVIVLDVSRRGALALGSIRRFDGAVNVASRLAQASLGSGDQLSLLAYDRGIVAEHYKLRGQSGLKVVRETLLNLRISELDANPALASSRILQHLPKRALVVWLTDTDDPTVATQLAQAIGALKRKYLSVVCAWLDPDLKQLARQHDAQLRWRAPAQRFAAIELMREQAMHIQSLRDLGAYVVQAEPEKMDQQVLSAYADVRRRNRL
jgi:uncharacterized protein (DUF58 family)